MPLKKLATWAIGAKDFGVIRAVPEENFDLVAIVEVMRRRRRADRSTALRAAEWRDRLGGVWGSSVHAFLAADHRVRMSEWIPDWQMTTRAAGRWLE